MTKKVVVTRIVQYEAQAVEPSREDVSPGDDWLLVQIYNGERIWMPAYRLATPLITDHSKVKIIVE